MPPGSCFTLRPADATHRPTPDRAHLALPGRKLEREQAALELTDDAQAVTQAAILLEHGDLAESRRLSRLAQHLYASEYTHRRRADPTPRTSPGAGVAGAGHRPSQPQNRNYRL